MGVFHGRIFLTAFHINNKLTGLTKEIMMRHLITLLTGMMLIFCLTFSVYAEDKFKVGVVDLQKFQQNSVGFQKIREAYIKKLEPQGKELEKLQQELVKLEEGLRQQSMMLSLDAKEDRRIELGKKSRKYKFLENEFMTDVKQAEGETIRNIGGDIQKIVEKIGKEKGYIMILEKRAVGFLYTDERVDITDEVIAAYDKMKQ
jgi:outer membrane protein